MKRNVLKEINEITSKYFNTIWNEVLRLNLENDISSYLTKISIEDESFPYELRIKEHLKLLEDGSINIIVGIYNTRLKEFIDLESKEGTNYKVKLLRKQYGL